MLKRIFKDINLYDHKEIPYLLDYLLPQNEPRKDLYYTPKKELIFENGKYLLIDINTKKSLFAHRFVKYINPITNFATISACFALMLSTHFYISTPMLITVLTYLYNKHLEKLTRILIKEIHLLSDGKHIQVNTFFETITYDIKDVRKLNRRELMLYFYYDILESKRYFPIVMGQRIFHIDPNYIDVELFPVICNSSYVKVPKDEKKNIITINT